MNKKRKMVNMANQDEYVRKSARGTDLTGEDRHAPALLTKKPPLEQMHLKSSGSHKLNMI
jgi:hypothetical protein